MRRATHRARGFTLIELLVVMAVIALLIGLLLPVLAKARAQARKVKDATQIQQIHQAWLVYASESEGILPTPGLIDREPIVLAENEPPREMRGRGLEDVERNTTDNIHSACIMNNYYTPELCVGPTEPNASVFVLEDYDREVYSPIDGVYWDPNFDARLDSDCNISYASMPLTGTRKRDEWRSSHNSKFAVIGNRGVKDGAIVESNLTYEIHSGYRQWVGNVCYNDNHMESHQTPVPEGLECTQDGIRKPDNLFANDTDTGGFAGADIWLVIVSEVVGEPGTEQLTLEWDF